MALVRGPNIVNDGIVYCWDVGNLMSYPGSGTTLADLVGTANLTVNGSPTLTSTGPWYFTFPLSQTTTYLIKNPFTMPTTDITMEMWVRFVATDSQQALISYAISGDDNECIMFLNGGEMDFYGPGRGGGAHGTSWEPSSGVWYHLIRSRVESSGEDKLYVDGVEKFSGSWDAGTGFTTGGSFVFGQEQDSVGGGFSSSQCFGGDLSLIRIYDRALTAAEVLQNYNALKSRFGH